MSDDCGDIVKRGWRTWIANCYLSPVRGSPSLMKAGILEQSPAASRLYSHMFPGMQADAVGQSGELISSDYGWQIFVIPVCGFALEIDGILARGEPEQICG